nr:arabinosyltransferase domain-containing protein [Arenivirga flava]
MMLTAAIAMLAGFALAIAPVTQPEVTVTWPQEGQEVESTALLLANQTPHRLELELTGAAVQSASGGGGTVFATMRPDRVGVDETAGDIGIPGLLVSVSGDQLSWATGFERLESAWSVDDVWTLTSSVDGMIIERDGAVAAQWDTTLPPQIDALITDARGQEAAALSASVQAVDDASTESTAVKWIVLVIALAALVASAVLIRRDDRRIEELSAVAARPRPRRDWRLGVIDAAVVTAVVVWTFIGSMTADDGYYATMSLNNDEAGFVGNYFQMFNQPFAPFVWFWQLLDVWQQIGGSSAVWLRIPSLIAAVAAWFVVRAFVRSYVHLEGALQIVLVGLAGIVFVAWWSAFNIGTRPESVASLATILAVLLISRAIERSRLLPAFGAVVVASLAFTAHPTGVVAFAPLLLSVPALWRIASSNGSGLGAALARTAGVASGGVAALIAAFHDASLYDGLSSQRRFAAVETPVPGSMSWGVTTSCSSGVLRAPTSSGCSSSSPSSWSSGSSSPGSGTAERHSERSSLRWPCSVGPSPWASSSSGSRPASGRITSERWLRSAVSSSQSRSYFSPSSSPERSAAALVCGEACSASSPWRHQSPSHSRDRTTGTRGTPVSRNPERHRISDPSDSETWRHGSSSG